METENKKRTGIRPGAIIIAGLILVVLIYYSVVSVMSPLKKMDEMKASYEAKLPNKKSTETVDKMDSSFVRLLKDKSFLQSRIVMAETDSIYLTLNMLDSTANLEISGVVVHKAKMKSIKTSKILVAGDENTISALLSSPLTITGSFATIKKEPVMIKVAPKDTSEYKPDIMPDTSLTEPVFIRLATNMGIRIYIYQAEKTKVDDRTSRFNFDMNDRLIDTWAAIKKAASFKVPDYHPYIKITLPRADAKIIYRALPKNGQIALYT
jgi:hypothetical protein